MINFDTREIQEVNFWYNIIYNIVRIDESVLKRHDFGGNSEELEENTLRYIPAPVDQRVEWTGRRQAARYRNYGAIIASGRRRLSGFRTKASLVCTRLVRVDRGLVTSEGPREKRERERDRSHPFPNILLSTPNTVLPLVEMGRRLEKAPTWYSSSLGTVASWKPRLVYWRSGLLEAIRFRIEEWCRHIRGEDDRGKLLRSRTLIVSIIAPEGQFFSSISCSEESIHQSISSPLCQF